MIEKTALHRVGEDSTKTRLDSLNRVLGERYSSILTCLFPQLSVEFAEMFRAKFRQFVPSQVRQEAVNVLLVTGQRGFRQLVRCDIPEPELNVLRQRNRFVHRQGSILALPLEEDRLLIEPFFFLLWCESLRRPHRFLLCSPALAGVIVAHGDDQEVAASPFPNTCHFTSSLLSSVRLRFFWQAQHTLTLLE